MGQYCFAGWRLSFSSSVTLPAVGNIAGAPVAWAVGRPTLHGGPVVLRPVRATPCFNHALFVLLTHISLCCFTAVTTTD